MLNAVLKKIHVTEIISSGPPAFHKCGSPSPRGGGSRTAASVGWAKARSAVPTRDQTKPTRVGFASLSPPYETVRELILSRVSFMRRVSDSGGRARPRIQITETARAADHVRHTFRYRPILAVPVNATPRDRVNCAPGRITIRTARRSSEHRHRCKGRDTNRQSSNSFPNDASPSSA